MKKSIRITAMALAWIMLVTVLGTFMTGCDTQGKNPSAEETTASTTEQTTDGSGEGGTTEAPSGKVEYTVSVKSIGGRPISGLTFHIFEGDDLVAYGKTDENGVGTVQLIPSEGYTVELSASDLEGYTVEERYAFNGKTANIVLTSSVIADSDLTGVQYALGDIIRDFTVTTSDGGTFTLSEALKTKKAVLINFWYSTCGPCVNEFPYMQSAYEKYQDDIEVIALNNYSGDNENSVRDFKDTMGLTFPMAKDYSRLGSAFNLAGYPTSIMIDRYGTICLIEVGGLTSEKPFISMFDHFTSDNYVQKVFTSLDELTPAEKPNVEAPSSDEIDAAFSGSGFTALYSPEVDTPDAEYSWPFVTGSKNGASCVYPSNSYKDNSYAILHATVELKAGDALAVDWFADTELGVDVLYVLVDGKDIYQISGESEDWATCYPFVALDDGSYKVSFVYVKDGSTDTVEDRVYLKNLRATTVENIDAPTYIPRKAATKPNSNGLGYQNYIQVVYNSTDGYYHVGNENGPLLLVDLMGSTLLSQTSLNDLGYNGELVDGLGDVYTVLVDYCNYAINGTLYGYSPVTEELKGLLERAAELVGFEQGNPNQWLQACSYYDAYGTNGVQLDDPVKGVAFFAAFDTLLSTDAEEKLNTVTYDGRVIMPRGLKYKFVPQVSGAYIIQSQSEDEVQGWIFDETYEIIHTAAVVDRPYDGKILDMANVSMIVYLEAEKTYYIDIAYYDIYGEGSFTFTVKYLGESYRHFHLASPGYFTYTESLTGQLNQTVAGGIDVALGADGYYHELLADGTLGSIVYADFKYPTGIFSHSIVKMIEMDGFNLLYSETDKIALAKLAELGGDVEACRTYYRELWGESYAEWEAVYKLEEIFAGKYHGVGQNYTEEMAAYLQKMIPASDEYPELEGCVPVDERLAEILQALMDEYTFKGVEHSWTKLCYYYKNIAA